MELRKPIFKNDSFSRIILERTDNGVILSEITEDNSISSKVVYETYYVDGVADLYRIEELLIDIMNHMKIPIMEPIHNARISFDIVKIDDSLPGIEDIDDEEDDEDTDD